MANENMRAQILDAVYRVVGRNGLSNTTIDSIAAEAGISKGGVLYYFANKKDLLTGMVDRYEAALLERRAEILAELPPTPHSLLKATIIAMLEDLEKTRGSIPNFAGMLDDDELRKHVGLLKKRILKETSANVPHPEKVALVMFTVDGLWQDVRFKPPVVVREVREGAVTELMRYIDSLDA